MNTKRTCFASVINISEIEQSEIYLTIKARLFETPRANLNGVRVTAAFLDEIVEHQDAYVCVPLYADVHNLAAKNFEHLGHLYDASTGEFHSTQIGSFYKFEKEQTADGFALVGYARVMKRNKAVCAAVMELFATNSLKLSFEISCGSYQVLEDDTILIDASKDNYLEGMAIVSFPACQNAVALQLVAENAACAEATKENDMKGVNDMLKNVVMTDEKVVNAEQSDMTENVNAEVVAEECVAADKNEEAVAACGDDKECAESGSTETASTEEVASIEETEEDEKEDEEVEEETASCKKENAEVEISEEKVPEENEITEEEEDEAKKENAEVQSQFAELNSKIAELTNIIAELSEKMNAKNDEAKEIIAEVEADINNDIAPVNPVVAEIKIESKYTLLDPVKPEHKEYSLLEKA